MWARNRTRMKMRVGPRKKNHATNWEIRGVDRDVKRKMMWMWIWVMWPLVSLTGGRTNAYGC